MPLRSGWVEARAGWRASEGAYGRAEVGARLLPRLGVFAFGEATHGNGRPGLGVGIGGKFEFDW